MIQAFNWLRKRARLGATTFALVALAGACGDSDGRSPTSETPTDEVAAGDSLGAAPVDSTAAPADSTLGAPGDSSASPDSTVVTTTTGGTAPGIVFGIMGMRSRYMTSVYTGSKQGLDPQFLLSELATARSKGGRMILEMASGRDERIQNANGTFSLTKWKQLVGGFRALDFGSYIADGTLMGHFLIDEPQNAKKWGGKVISQATVEAMAKHSKQLWPGLTTFVRVAPRWLAQAPITYTYLDAGWTQYTVYMGDVTSWITAEVAAAKTKGLGLAVGMNVLDGGNGSSRIAGTIKGKYSMSALEIRSYGTALLSQIHACGFFSWTHLYTGATYFARSDIKSAMTELSNKAKAHPRTSCRQ